MTKRATTATDLPRADARSRERRVVRRSSVKKRLKTVFALLLLVVETAVAIALVSFLAIFWKFSSELPNVANVVGDIRPPIATTIYSQDGELLGKLDVENRQPITLDEMSKNILNATIAIEDHRFYEHPGVDVVGIGRAVVANFTGKRLSQGASTLTQQLVRNLNQFGLSREKRFPRKIREALIALRMEQVYSKRDILQLYLNNVYYGAGAYGIQAASLTYFGKSAYKLSLPEAALLAGIVQRPSAFTPFDNLKAALKRRDEVLNAMREYGYITAAQCEEAKESKPRLMPRPERKNFNFKAPYFVNYALRILTNRYGSDFVYSGLKIETTLNWKMQQLAEKVIAAGLEHGADFGANQGALVSLDNQTGYIRAMVGGRSFHADQYNAVTGRPGRQPGSTFKVFDYTAAFDTDTSDLHSAFKDEPIPYPNDPHHRIVKNYSGGYSYRYIDCLSAIKFSKNTIAVQVAKKVGIRTVIDYAKRMGITTPLAPYLPTALGASEVRPLDLCSAYSIFPMKGNRCLPMAVVRVSDSEGNILEENRPEMKTDLLKPSTVQQMETALEAVVTSGTGTKARGTESNGIVENAHGKTGTTSDNLDAWFAGYTPELSTVIWVASVHRNKRGRPYYTVMQGATGGALCAPIWHDFMIQAVPEQRKFKMTDEPTTSAQTEAGAEKADEAKKAQAEARRAKAAEAKKSEQKDGFTPAEKPLPPGDSTAGPESAAPDTGNMQDSPPDQNDDDSAPPPDEPHTTLREPDSTQSAPSERMRVSVPQTTTEAPRPRTPAPPEMVSVNVCAESGQLATEWCPTTVEKRVTARQARRMRRCRQHHPPPGEG